MLLGSYGTHLKDFHQDADSNDLQGFGEKAIVDFFASNSGARLALGKKRKRADHDSDVSEDENVDEILEESHPRDDHYKVIPPSDR